MRFESVPAITMTSSFSKAAQAYRSVSLESRVASSTGSELVSLLFEGFLERVKLAKLAMELGDVNGRVLHLGKALQILSEGLRTHLDMKSGGELAKNLDTLYHYCSMRLAEANLKSDVTMLVEVHDLIDSVAQAWKQNWVDANTNHALDSSAGSAGLGMFANQIKGFSGLAAYASSAQAGG
jgi:flagellar protein FliS